ncbi:MAG: hypothetical protein RQ872_00140 [Sulfolobaceae archaeon]|nr:hypothetical protein [Sulfolobaceae archaeon]
MPLGNIVSFDTGTFDGTVTYDFLVKSIKLGGHEKSFNYVIDLEYKPEKLYVVLNIKRRRDVEPKWRLWLNEFSLTKEFRPNIEIDTGTLKLSSIIYDITPLAKIGKNEFSVSYKGLQEISLESIGYIAFYKAEQFITNYNLMSGVLALRPLEHATFQCNGECYLIVNNDKEGKLIVDNYEISGDEPEEIKFNKTGEIEVKSVSQNSKSLGYVYAFYSLKYKVPKIDVDIDYSLEGDSLTVKAVSNSEITLDKVIINVLLNGISINYRVFENIKPNSVIEYPVKLNGFKKGILNIRVVSIKAGYRKIFDKTLQIK